MNIKINITGQHLSDMSTEQILATFQGLSSLNNNPQIFSIPLPEELLTKDVLEQNDEEFFDNEE